MSLTFKILSLCVRTVAKPIGNSIKARAKEHERFRRFAINAAQGLHRFDMRMRLGLLHDSAAQERMHEQAKKAAETKKKAETVPTVRTEAEQKQWDEQQAKEKNEGSSSKPKYRIRPLSDAKAIELGANFASESFVFLVAVGLILVERWYSSKKQSDRRDVINDRIDDLSAEVERLRSRYEPDLQDWHEKREAEKELERQRLESKPWYNPAGWWTRTESPREVKDGIETVHQFRPGDVEQVSEVKRSQIESQTAFPAESSPKEGSMSHSREVQNTSAKDTAPLDSSLSTRLNEILSSKKDS